MPTCQSSFDAEGFDELVHRCFSEFRARLTHEGERFMRRREMILLGRACTDTPGVEPRQPILLGVERCHVGTDDVELSLTPMDQKLLPSPVGSVLKPESTPPPSPVTKLMRSPNLSPVRGNGPSRCSNGISTMANGDTHAGEYDKRGAVSEIALPRSHCRGVSINNRASASEPKTGRQSQVKILSDLEAVIRNARAHRLQRNFESGLLEKNMHSSLFSSILYSPNTEKRLDAVMGAFIMLNVIQIGISTDYERSWRGWLVVDGVFAAMFVFEFVMKLLIHGLIETFFGRDWPVNWFDFLIVVFAIVELVLAVTLGGNGMNLSVFRIVRLLRLTRMIKVIRLPIFKDLLMMLEGLIGGARTLFWAMLLLVGPIYVSAIMLRETIGEDEEHTQLAKPFNTLAWSFFTCYRCIMGDCSNEHGQPLPVLLTNKFGPIFGMSFFLVTAFTSFGLFNVIAAIYLENIMVYARTNERIQRRRRLADRSRLADLMVQLLKAFVVADDDVDQRVSQLNSHRKGDKRPWESINIENAGVVEITKKTFEKVTTTPYVEYLFDHLDIGCEDRVELFDVLDADKSGTLTLDEVVHGLTKLRGEPRRSDVIGISLAVRTLQDQVRTLDKSVSSELRAIRSLIAKVVSGNHSSDRLLF